MSKRKTIWKPYRLTTRDHEEFKHEIIEAMLDLDFALRCYYIAMKDDLELTENERLDNMQKALKDALRATGDALPTNSINFN